jgi:hypothetical protein
MYEREATQEGRYSKRSEVMERLRWRTTIIENDVDSQWWL